MKKPFLLILILAYLTSCAYTRSINSSEIKNPPNKNFVKVYKEFVLTRCTKEIKKTKAKKCETRSSWSTGSGLVIDIIPNKVVVLTAGHVCSSSSSFPKEDKTYK